MSPPSRAGSSCAAYDGQSLVPASNCSIDPIAAILTGFGGGCTGFSAFPVSLIKDSKRSKKSENPRRQCSVLCYPMNTQ